MFSDIEDSTTINHDLGDKGWVQLLSKHDRVLKKAIKSHRGHVVKTQGDGFMVAFAEAEQAFLAARDAQRGLAEVAPESVLYGVKVRFGLHKGSVIRRDGDLFGRNVAFAARVAAQADGGEVMVSDALLNSLPAELADLAYETRKAELKGVPGLQTIHVMDWT
jgi:class 3 adenylate cyclase